MPQDSQNVMEREISFAEKELPPCWVKRKPHSGKTTVRKNGTKGIWSTNNGNELISKVVEYVRTANEIICVSSFLLDDSEVVAELIQASKKKRIYIITASENILEKEPKEESEFEISRLDEHKRVLNKLSGITLVRTADKFHAKFILTDPNSDSAKGILLTANITKDALTRNPEIGIELTQAEARDLFRQFKIAFWLESKRELLSPGRLSAVQEFSVGTLDLPTLLPCTLQDRATIKEALINLIDKAKTDIWVSTFSIDPDHEVSKRLISAAGRGVRVHLLTRIKKSDKHTASLVSTARAGVEVVGHQYLHAKALIVDDDEGPKGLVMTANIESKGLDEGFEAGVILHGERAVELRRLLLEWWTLFGYEFKTNVKIGEVSGEVLIPKNNAFTRYDVREREDRDLGTIEFRSRENIDETIDRLVLEARSKSPSNTLYQKVVLKFTLVPTHNK